MFNWKGYVTELARNVAAISAFVGAVCAFLDGYLLSGALFVIVYAFAATDAEWYYIKVAEIQKQKQRHRNKQSDEVCSFKTEH